MPEDGCYLFLAITHRCVWQGQSEAGVKGLLQEGVSTIMYSRKPVVRISITTTDGEVLDTFDVAHWRAECDSEDQESVGSHASEALLMDRIKRYVEVK